VTGRDCIGRGPGPGPGQPQSAAKLAGRRGWPNGVVLGGYGSGRDQCTKGIDRLGGRG
jgi:hypothetical protein